MDQQQANSSSRGKIIYLADPMCSWCYGFRDEITKLKTAHADQMDFSLIMGGLRPGGGDPWNQKMKDFLRHHWEKVAEVSGQAFQYDLLEWDEFLYDTEPSCRSVCVAKALAPEQAFDFFKSVQYRFYYENKDPKEVSYYEPICQELGIDFEQFRNAFSSEEYKALTRQDFEQSQNWGIRGFPSVVISWNNRLGLLSNGYASYAEMEDRMEKLLAKLSTAA